MSIKSILNQFENNNNQSVTDKKNKINLYAQIINTVMNNYSRQFLNKLFDVETADDIVESIKYLDRMNSEQLDEVLTECEKLYNTSNVNLINGLLDTMKTYNTNNVFDAINHMINDAPDEEYELDEECDDEPDEETEEDQKSQEDNLNLNDVNWGAVAEQVRRLMQM